MTIKDLPIEIYFNIFSRLSQECLKECLKVDKRWNYYVSQIYYQNIILNFNQIGQLSRLLQQNANISQWIRKVTFKKSYKRSRILTTKKDFYQLVTTLPYLKTICIIDPDKEYWYLENMVNLKLNIQQLDINLNSIITINQSILHLYYLNLAKFNHSITHLQLINIHLHPVLFKSCGNVLSYLAQFTRLSHLKLYRPHFNDTHFPSLSSILTTCHKLKSLYIQDRSRRDDSAADFLQESIEFFPVHLSHLQLQLTRFFTPYINYILLYISPNHLDSFLIEITDQFLMDWVEKTPSQMIDQFTNYLSRVKNLTFNTGKDSFSRGTNLLLKDAIPNCISTIYQITNKIINKRPLFLETKIVLNGTQRRPNTSIRVENNHHMQLKISFQDPDWYAAEEGIDIMDYISINKNVYKHTWTANAFQMIKWHLVPIHPIDILRIFSFLFKQCNYLYYIFITNSSSSFAAGPLIHSQDKVNIEYISNLTRRSKMPSMTLPTTKENLKYVSFENVRVSKDLLGILVNSLEVETLRLSRCIFENDTNNNVTLNIGNHVSSLILYLDARPYTYIFLEIEMMINDNKNSVYYQSQRKQRHSFELLPSSHPVYAFNRHASKNTRVFHIKCADLKQITVKTEYKRLDIVSILHPTQDIM